MPTSITYLPAGGSNTRTDPGQQPVVTSYTGDYRYVFDQKIPAAKRRKPTGWLQPQGYTREIRSYSCPTYIVRDSWTGNKVGEGSNVVIQGYGVLSLCGGNGPNLPSPESRLKNAAEIKALTNLKDQKVNLAVAWAEAQATANMVGTTASRIGRAYSSLRKGKWKDSLRHLGVASKRGKPRGSNVPSQWLELQYGWQPLLSDVYGACEQLANTRNQSRFWVATVVGTAMERTPYSREQHSDYGGIITEGTLLNSEFVRLDYEPWNSFLQQLTNLGATNPAEVAWEKVPFSFVVDWFAPVGDYLHALDADVGFDFKSGSRSSLQEARTSSRPTMGKTCSRHEWNGTMNWRQYKLERIVYPGSPWPKWPGFKNPISLGHMANGLALLASAFGR